VALRWLHRGGDPGPALRRHLGYFNTHPYMASPVLGTMLALEERIGRGEETALGVQEFKSMVMAPYAAMGDALFWGGIRPLAAVIALFLAAKGSLWAPVVFLAIFNLPHLWFRVFGLIRGYRLELDVVEGIRKYHLPDLAVRCKEGTVILLGGFSAYLVFLCLRKESLPALWGLLLLPAVFLCARLVRKGLSSQLLVLLVAATVVFIIHLG